MNSYVYLIESNGLYKIGKTDNLTKRLSQYHSHNPHISRIFVLVTNNSDNLENYFLCKHAEKRIGNNDWFELDEKDVSEFVFHQEEKSDQHKYKPIDRSVQKTNIQELQDEIMGFLKSANVEVNQGSLRSLMMEKGYSDKRTRAAIARIEAKNAVNVRLGPKGSKLYSCKVN